MSGFFPNLSMIQKAINAKAVPIAASATNIPIFSFIFRSHHTANVKPSELPIGTPNKYSKTGWFNSVAIAVNAAPSRPKTDPKIEQNTFLILPCNLAILVRLYPLKIGNLLQSYPLNYLLSMGIGSRGFPVETLHGWGLYEPEDFRKEPLRLIMSAKSNPDFHRLSNEICPYPIFLFGQGNTCIFTCFY